MQSVHLVPAHPDQKAAIANLIQLYLHDMTEFMPFPVGDDGLYQYDFLDRFWRHPYFIMADNEIAGFVLVVDECPLTGRNPCWFMAEVFVLKALSGQGHRPSRGPTSPLRPPRPMAHRRPTRQHAGPILLDQNPRAAITRHPRHPLRRRQLAIA